MAAPTPEAIETARRKVQQGSVPAEGEMTP